MNYKIASKYAPYTIIAGASEGSYTVSVDVRAGTSTRGQGTAAGAGVAALGAARQFVNGCWSLFDPACRSGKIKKKGFVLDVKSRSTTLDMCWRSARVPQLKRPPD